MNEVYTILGNKSIAELLTFSKCSKEYSNIPTYKNPLITISADELHYENISNIFIDKKKID